MSTAVSMELDPLRSVGPLVFGAPIQPLASTLGLTLRTDYPYGRSSDDEDTYQCPGVYTQVSVENGHVTDVDCWEKLHYQGRNIIGLDRQQVEQVIGDPEEEEMEDSVLYLYYWRLGIVLVIENGAIYHVSCFGPIEDESPRSPMRE